VIELNVYNAQIYRLALGYFTCLISGCA